MKSERCDTHTLHDPVKGISKKCIIKLQSPLCYKKEQHWINFYITVTSGRDLTYSHVYR